MYSELSGVRNILDSQKLSKKDKGAHVLGIPAFYGLGDIVDYLIGRRFNVNAVNPENGFTALHEAAVSGDVQIIKLLLRHKANHSAIDDLGETPLEKARFFGREEVASLLSSAK